MQELISKLRIAITAGLIGLLVLTVIPALGAQDASSQEGSGRKEMLASVARARKLGRIRIDLTPGQPGPDQLSIGWSPKGTKVPLTRTGETCQGQIKIGQHPPVSLEFSWNEDSGLLKLDRDHDGQFSVDETQSIVPSESRGKTWYSSQAVIQLPFDQQRTRPYPISIWYVFDPEAEQPDSIIRWSRRGWHLGTFDFHGQTAYAVITDRNHDGRFDNRDAFGLGTELKATFAARNTMNSVEEHAWLGEVPFRVVECDSDGRFLVIEAFDLGRTRAEDAVARDPYAADRQVERAKQPVEFANDFNEARNRCSEKQPIRAGRFCDHLVWPVQGHGPTGLYRRTSGAVLPQFGLCQARWR